MTSKRFFSTVTIFILLLFQNKVYATNNTKNTTTKTETKGTTVKSSQKTESTTKNSKINKKINEDSADNMYMVRDLIVSRASTDSVKAKEICIKEAQRKALKTILNRAKIDNSYTKYIDDKTLEEMVESIQIRDEMITKNSYSSKMTVVFGKKFLNFYLKKAGIGVNRITYDVFLYIPIFKNKNKKINPISENDTWYKSSYDNFFEKKYENIFIIDNYSLSNSGLISEEMILKPKYNDFSTLLKKYSSNVVSIAIAEYDSNENSIVVNYTEVDGDKTTNKTLTYFNKNNLSQDDLIKEVAVKMLEYLNGESQTRIYKKKGQEQLLPENITGKNNIDVILNSTNINDYVHVKNLLINLDFISKIEPVEITSKYTKLRLYYKCNESELLNLFKNKGFEMNEKSGNYFIKYIGF